MTAATRRLALLAGVPRPRIALAALLGALTVLFGVGLMATAGFLISRAAEQPSVLSLAVAIVGVRFFGLARPIARYLERLASHDVALRSVGTARARVYERLERLSPAQLQGRRRGDLLANVVADVDSLQNLHLRGLLPPVVALVAGAGAVGVVAVVLPQAALVLAAGLLTGGVVVPYAAAALARRSAAMQAPARGALSAGLVESLAGGAELAAYGRLEQTLETIGAVDRRLVRVARRAALADGAGEGLRLLLAGATVAGVLALAVSAHAAGGLDRVLIALLALVSVAAFEAVQPLPEALRELRAAVAAGERILELTDREPAVADPADPLPLPQGRFALALEEVRLRYAPGERPALDGVSLRLEPGRRVALVGRSGSGKTSVANLLLRFVDPEDGRVTLGGRDLREYRLEDVRRAIALAGQDSHLFSTTIRENVRLGRPDATDDEIEDALRRARLLDWVRGLPDGWSTLVGEEGRELSGGQRQRLVVARALLANAPVLVLDEPTAHLDAATAERLLDDVFDAAGDRAVLLITHRPEGLERVDDVVALAGEAGSAPRD
ncbi:MAG TPA: thiol reductant ABC exporter subunit CydC [Solirubrobacteraceae bacterium]|nr:thiol reductant ABC exporter subunit CydC [Solirubrobacteraceae bacterium]